MGPTELQNLSEYVTQLGKQIEELRKRVEALEKERPPTDAVSKTYAGLFSQDSRQWP